MEKDDSEFSETIDYRLFKKFIGSNLALRDWMMHNGVCPNHFEQIKGWEEIRWFNNSGEVAVVELMVDGKKQYFVRERA